MKESTKRHFKCAAYGARSRNYIGVKALLAAEWFHETSSENGEKTYHPTPKPIRQIERDIDKLKAEFLSTHGQESLSAWRGLIEESTSMVSRMLSWDDKRVVGWNESRETFMRAAADAGLSHLRRLATSWSPDPSFGFDGGEELFYLRVSKTMDKNGHRKIKVGRTTEKARVGRLSAYRTNGGGDSEEEYCIPAHGDLNERRVIEWLASNQIFPVIGREWYVVPDSIFNILKSPSLLRAEINASEGSMESRPVPNREGQGQILHDAPISSENDHE